MPRKVVSVYIPKEIKGILETLSVRLGLPESEVLRMALLDYAKDICLLQRKVLGRKVESTKH